ncbi:Beta-ketoacyl synthase protein [Rutstroemia sp. NJR-2017a BBW]|nr:Beta-ketoacyl synthase protein [Rutstroemia sp. NJR-2017a BBW]
MGELESVAMTATNSVRSPNGLLDESDDLSDFPPHSIAVIGMAGRFPDADSVDELWELLVQGKSTVKRADVERLQLSKTGIHADTNWWGNWLQDPTAFDHRFFKKSSREALAWDPQQRVLLQVVYEALESAGYFGPSATPETDDYGCYVGAVMNSYYENLGCHPPNTYATIGTGRAFLSGSISHYFGWIGPSLTIDTACSSSLVAINAACRAIWSGECTRAVAGGTNVISSPGDYQNLQSGGFLSPTGQCKPFDASADGYCRGEGVGAVVLKRLSDAVADKDNILGVIVGSGANQNHNVSHITVPHADSQFKLYNKVMKMGNVRPEAVTYVEAHGTGTRVGDPVEVNSIRHAYGGPQRDSTLYVASIKGNIGHTEAAAGVSGLIKVLLMMKHGKIPRQASYKQLNPQIPSLDQDRMAVPTSVIPWNPPVRVACVNSHSAAGSNSTLLLREKPHRKNTVAPLCLKKYPLIFSAGSANSLSMYSKKLLDWVKGAKDGTSNLLATLAFNLADRTNHKLPYILSTSVSSIQDLKSKLEAASSGLGIDTVNTPKPVVLVFGGQDSDYVGLCKDIFNTSKVFRTHLDLCNDILMSRGLESIYPAIFQLEPIDNLMTLHSALFAVQYASAKAWMECGLTVDGVIGHSFGQLTAFCISGCLSLADALTLVVERAFLMQKYWGDERGAMLSMQTDRGTVEQVLQSLKTQDSDFYAEIACYNGPRNYVVGGSSESVNVLEQHVSETPSLRGSVRTKRLRVTHGFHSRFTEPILARLTAVAKQLDWKRSTLHLEICDEFGGVTEPDFEIIAQCTRRPVYFQQAVERLTKRFSQITWIESGRGSSVNQLVKDSIVNAQEHTFISPQLSSSNAQDSLTDTTTELWKYGYAVQYWPFHRSQKLAYEHLSLPPYQFEKTRHWLPYVRRGAEVEVKQDEKIEETHELISFLQYKDKSQKEAVFRVDPQSDRFQALVGGHVIAGETLVPAALFFEIISRAALYLQNRTDREEYVPTVKDLAMKYPIGSHTSTEITLTLKRLEDKHPSWSFTITTKNSAQKVAESKQSTGKVYLKKRGDTQAARDFKRFESLTGHRRYREVSDHPSSEKMQGKHLYRAFGSIVNYSDIYQGVKEISCLEHEAAAKVIMSPDIAATDQRLCDTLMIDSFMQLSGFLVNYFNNPSLDDIFLCMHIEHAEIGGSFNPDAKEWVVYATQGEDDDSDASSDIYVFEAESKRMVMAVFGCRFMKMRKDVIAQILKDANQPVSATSSRIEAAQKPAPRVIEKPTPIRTKTSPTRSPGKRAEIFKILSDVTDYPVDEIKGESSLEDFGIDSLMATEVLNDIRSTLDLNIDLTSFLLFRSINALVAHVNESLGLNSEDGDLDATPSSDGSDDVDSGFMEEIEVVSKTIPEKVERPVITSAFSSFDKMRLGYDQIAEQTKATGFFANAYPHQERLVLAYVVEAFADLGCDWTSLQPGDRIPELKTLPKHTKLMRQLHRILEDGNVIQSTNQGFVLTDSPLDPTPAESIYQQTLNLHPEHDIVLKLVRSVGSQLASCLSGEKDGLQVVFGDREVKQNLETMYEFWPLLRSATILLGDILQQTFTHSHGTGKFRILEVGAGTGGTTRYIVEYLRNCGIPFEYVFTDISASLVGAARKKFKGVEGMEFEVLDLEKEVSGEYKESFHCIIATNCVHATRDLVVTLSHIRKMLREDGALMLVETTENMYWLDIVVGLFEGWWLFEDGREHALADEGRWERALKEAGFAAVGFSGGETREARTVRVIGGFVGGVEDEEQVDAVVLKPEGKRLETVVYKRVREQDIHADIYYPADGRSYGKKMPIALMIHGGSHILFSRKDIRPAQTNLLLEKGFLPVSLDHRLCPEVSLLEGAMVDIRDALSWARHSLPSIVSSHRPDLQADPTKVVVVGWSSGGQLAMSLAWTAPQIGLPPPAAILAFYPPTNYEDPWWQHPIQPIGAADQGQEYDVLDGVQDHPITNYDAVRAWEPLSDPGIHTDPRCRIVLHMNWKAQTLPIILGGLPPRSSASFFQNWNALPQPSIEKIIAASPLAQIKKGNYKTPTFLIHGTADDLIPWKQSWETYEAMREAGVQAQLELVQGAEHICDRSSDPESEGWMATVSGYAFLEEVVFVK